MKKAKVQLWKILTNLPKCTLCPFITSQQLNPPLVYFPLEKKNQVCVAEITGEIHLMTVLTDGLSITADIISSVSVGIHSLFGVACKISVEFYVSSSADAGSLFLVNFQTGHCEHVLSNGSASLKEIHGICSKSDGKVNLVDRGANKIKEFDVASKQVTNFTGSGHTGSRGWSDLTASFSQPTGVCCEKGSHLTFVVGASSGRLRLITSVQALIKYLQKLWLFLSAFNLTGTTTRLCFDETVTRVQHYYAFHEEASFSVSRAQLPRPKDQKERYLLLHWTAWRWYSLTRLRTKVMELNPNFIQHLDVESLLNLFVENFFSSMRGGNTDTPTMFAFCLRFPHCINELLKCVTGMSYRYFTNPVASYYLQPT